MATCEQSNANLYFCTSQLVTSNQNKTSGDALRLLLPLLCASLATGAFLSIACTGHNLLTSLGCDQDMPLWGFVEDNFYFL